MRGHEAGAGRARLSSRREEWGAAVLLWPVEGAPPAHASEESGLLGPHPLGRLPHLNSRHRAGEPVSEGNGLMPKALQVPGCVLFMAMMLQAQCLAARTQR